MEEPADFQDWELLYSSDSGLDVSSPDSAGPFKGFGGLEGDTYGGIKSDYFVISSEKPCAGATASDGGGFPDSGDSGAVDPNSELGCMGQQKGEPVFEKLGFTRCDSGGFLTSGEFSSGQTSVPDYREGENLEAEEGLEEIEAGDENFGVVLSDVDGDGGEAERKEVGSGGIEEAVGVEAEGGKPDELGSVDSPKGRDGMENSEERSAGEVNLGSLSVGEGDKTQMIWWKLPWELLKVCAFKVKPVWSISVAATLIGVVMVWRRLYNLKPNTRKLPLKISIDDKKASQFMVQAARLNEAFQVVRRAPVIRPLPASGSTLWPVVALR